MDLYSKTERQYGLVWLDWSPGTHIANLSIGTRFMDKDAVAFGFWLSSMKMYFFPPSSSEPLSTRRLPAPSPTLLALLADLPLSGCWPAVVDRIIEEYPETEPYIRPVLEAYDASTSTVSETDTVGAYSSAK